MNVDLNNIAGMVQSLIRALPALLAYTLVAVAAFAYVLRA